MTGLAPLILVVGPSGAGKDTLLEGAARELEPTGNFSFATRVITRPVTSDGEQHIEISTDAFNQKEAEGYFLLSWRAHGYCYGILAEPTETLRTRGCAVVASVSRTVIDDAKSRHQPVHVIVVTAPKTVLERRLANRGREPEADVLARLERSNAIDVSGQNVTIIENTSDVKSGIRQMISALEAASSFEWKSTD